jgi:hypothetical protein
VGTASIAAGFLPGVDYQPALCHPQHFSGQDAPFFKFQFQVSLLTLALCQHDLFFSSFLSPTLRNTFKYSS